MKLNYFLIIGFSILYSCGNQEQGNKSNQNNEELAGYSIVNNDLKVVFTTDISSYFDAVNKGNWDAVINMIYPKLFDLITKEQMIKSFNQLDEMGMDLKTDFNKIEKISEVINYENSKFCRVYYNARFTIKISGVMIENKDQLGQSFIAYYGAENIKYDDTNSKFEIKAKKSMIAVSKTNSNEWSYIEYNEPEEEILKQLIPEKVLVQIIN